MKYIECWREKQKSSTYTPRMSWIKKKASECNSYNPWYCSNGIRNALRRIFKARFAKIDHMKY